MIFIIPKVFDMVYAIDTTRHTFNFREALDIINNNLEFLLYYEVCSFCCIRQCKFQYLLFMTRTALPISGTSPHRIFSNTAVGNK
jgi:hypothetical protein